jgi:hypothetical protein
MIRPRRDRAPRDLGLGRLSHSLGTSGDGAIVQWSAVVRDPPRPIDPFFHLHLGRPDVVADLIELPMVGYGPIAVQDARDRADGDRQIVLQKLIRRLQRRDLCQPQLLDQSIPDGLKEPLHPTLRLWRVSRDQLNRQLAHATSILKLTFSGVRRFEGLPGSDERARRGFRP